MRLAATLTTMRDAARQPVELRGTLRDPGEMPRDVVILDVSVTGFRAELPGDVAIEPGTRVRIAASAFGVHEAIAVRSDEGGSYGFAFVRPVAPAALAALDGEQPSSITPFPIASMLVPAAAEAQSALDRPRISARASLAIMVGISCALWVVLAAIIASVSFFA